MLEILKRLSLGFMLLAFAAGVLLYTDQGTRRSAGKPTDRGGKPLRVALVQFSSIEALEQGAAGVLQALEEHGYASGGRMELKKFNAEGDIGTANAIAKEVTGGDYGLILSVSTVSMQTIANANRFAARTTHVFGLVTDPYAAGVGIEATNHMIHPPYMAGAGSMQPVERIFQTMRRMRPELKSVGLVWNSAEANSLAQTKVARKICAEMGIELIEANAENSSSVLESANSVIARGAEAIWVSGDVTVLMAVDQIISASRRARLPVITSVPPTVAHGSLFDLGANYVEVGRHQGEIAAAVLDGKSPATMPIDNFVPVLFLYNETVLPGLRDKWTIPAELKQEAQGSVTDTATNLPNFAVAKQNKTARRPEPGRVYKIGLAYFAPESGCDECQRGIFDGLRALGFAEGKNLKVLRAHAQAEIANIPAVLQNFDGSDVDVIVPMSTPLISGACAMVKHKPVVFTYCSDPVAAGVGQSFTNHLPFITGIGSFPPVQDMVNAIRQTIPGVKTVGTIYNASEANSVKVVTVAREVFARAGIKLEEVTVSTSADVFSACQALAGRNVDVLYIQGDNTVAQGFDAVVRVANDERLPLFVDDPDLAKRGALACVGLGYYQPGYAIAKSLAKVLMGESPATIPVENVSQKSVWLNQVQAAKLGLKFPDDLVAEAARASAKTNAAPAAVAAPGPLGHKAKIDVLEYLETPNAELNREGLLAGFKQAGFVEGRDMELRFRNAQGDMATLSTMVDSSVADGADVLFTVSTPALQAALRRADKTRVVFSLVANPVIAGAGKSDADHLPNITGSYLTAPQAEGLAALRQCLPNVKRIGTLFCPAEVNSVYYKDELLKAAAALGLEVELVGVSSSSEVADGALALCSRPIDVVVQISDNLTAASFASIAQAVKRARLPLMAFATGQAQAGAFMTVSRDFYDGGVASAEIAVRVLRGEAPAKIPFHSVQKIVYTFNPAAAAAVGVIIPQGLLSKGTSIN